METQFNLSDKIISVINLNNKDLSVIPVGEVKEFIKRLKEELGICDDEDFIFDKINEIAGDKLIGEEKK